ncbi:tyrosine-type recombinase/integrase [Streptomyces turgidiscabies]|uniref:Integrase n=1 Tax=Streptomyces turgidiscabies TaxID=85558 RepID=A0ABU0RV82_9ACTN|nr:site-specific integrase [Streptomyces turgidiscabies]MDQ0935072.1 integrase [Streptomyces turgidiscabies]
MSSISSALSRLPAPRTDSARDLDGGGWAAWLRGHLDPAWRASEWRQDCWLFTGSVHEPRSSVALCRTQACDTVVSPANIFCPFCKEEQKRSPLPDAEFARAFVPVRNRVAFGGVPQPCSFTKDGQRCVRPRHCKELCATHYTQWKTHTTRKAAGRWEDTAVPYADTPACPAPACPLPGLYGRGLCRHHAQRFREHRRTHPDADVASWAVQQPPYLAPHQFSLLPLPEPLRWEVLYGLQQVDPWLRIFEPPQVRRMVRDLAETGTLIGDITDQQMCPRSTVAVLRMLGRVRTAVRAGHAEYTGTAPAQDDVLDLRALGQRSRTPAGIRQPKTVDLRTIRQPWLRGLLRTWTVQQRPGADEFARTLRGVELASRALAQRPGTDDPTRLRYDDVTAVAEAFRTALKLDGQLAGWNYRMSISSHFFALIDYGRRSGTADTLSAAFVRDPALHRIPEQEANEDEIGKAIPEPVIRQLDAHLHLLGLGRARGQRTLAADDLQLMYHTLYTLLRDTGRRPLEVCSLPRDCLETRNDQISLVWNNHKARRHRRRLPITTPTAQAIRTWQERREQLHASLPSTGADYLFPALTHLATRPYLHTSYLSETLRHWVDSIPHLHGEGTDTQGNPLPFDRSLIYAYAFRHSYAQRHADAGTPLDVLRELMDHKSVSTTQRYYTVSLKRKRDAVTKLAAHVVDNHGRPRPSSDTTYELRSVAVPYGGCTEPSNVKAAGGSCPIRFQCAGCGFYRPDPSYLPAIEQHLNELRADRETALAMDAAEFVITAFTAQITAYEQVTERMQRRLAALPAAQRQEIEEASTILRKARAGNTHTLLPLTTVPRTDPA